ncbi:MAG: hypothetical protein ACXADS_13305 [Candidatus Thorarchaeota archaeon]|jgi:hypothetical protein
MPVTPTEAAKLKQEGQLEGLNLMLALIGDVIDWDPRAKQWLSLAGDIDATHRIQRGDFANMRQTKIENRIATAIENIRYHLVEAEKYTGRERENHLERVQTFLRYIRRLKPTAMEVQRTIANVNPWPQMMRASLNLASEGGNVALLTPGMAGMFSRMSDMLKGTDAPPALTEPEEEDVVDVEAE